MGLMQLTRLVQVDCPLGPDVLLLQRMEGREELGRLFAYELHLVSENPNLPLEQLLGKPMSLSLELPGGSRRFFTASSRAVARWLGTASSPATRPPCGPGRGC